MSDVTRDSLSLYSPAGERKYLNRSERQRVLEMMERLARRRRDADERTASDVREREAERALFTALVGWTGGRVSEVLAVRADSFQLDRNVVALRTLKRRKPHVREVPVKPGFLAAVDRHFGLRELQRNPETANRRLWNFSRVTAWRFVKRAMMEAGVVGRAACPRGLRHGFAVGTLQACVPLHLVQKWMGHADMSTTAIYADVCGDDEAAFAERFWGKD
jgi:site-specific recombinase XerD